MNNEHMSIGVFAKASGVTKATLMHYESIGLFYPYYTSENGYRFYNEDQIFRIEAITQLRSIDMSLTEIKDFLDTNTREQNLEILKKNKKIVEDKLFRFGQIERLLHTTIKSIETEPNINLEEPFLERQTSPIYLYIYKTTKRDGTITKHLPILRSYLQKYKKQYLNTNNAVGEIVLNKHIVDDTFQKTFGCFQLEHQIDDADCYEKPSGLYLSMYYRGHSNNLPDAYQKLKKYAYIHNYLIINNAYEEDISTVISENNRSRFILKVSFQIEDGCEFVCVGNKDATVGGNMLLS